MIHVGLLPNRSRSLGVIISQIHHMPARLIVVGVQRVVIDEREHHALKAKTLGEHQITFARRCVGCVAILLRMKVIVRQVGV